MSWNEPGGRKPGGRNNDPWGGRNDQGPPDLDEMLKNLGNKLNALLGGGGGGNSSGDDGKAMLLIVAIVAGVVFLWSVFYTVEQAEEAVVLRFGKYYATEGPGLNFRWPIVDKVTIVNTSAVEKETIRARMISKDVNFVDIDLEVQYRISDPRSYVTKVTSAEEILRHATESALRHVAGGTDMEQLISKGRATLADDVRSRLKVYLNNYNTGLLVLQVNVVEALPPQEVREAFVDVNKAPKDQERMVNQAQAYSNQVIPEARGQAQRMLEEAKAYKESLIATAEGDAERFNKLYAEYKRAPLVTRKRLYLETMEQVIGNSNKVMIDVEKGSNLLYLPLDKLQRAAPIVAAPSTEASSIVNSAQEAANSAKKEYGNWRERLRKGGQ